MKNSTQLPRVFYLAFGGVGFLLLAIAALLFFFDQRAANLFTRIEGTVIQNQIDGGTARPVVSYSWEGKDLTYVSNTSTNPPAFEPGERVDLFVNPNDPTDVSIDSFVERYLGMTIVGGIGVVFLGFLALFHYLSQR